MPVDHLFAAPVLLDAIREMDIPDLVIVSPDAGGVERARAIAKRLDAGLAIVDKRRVATNEAEVMNIIGEVEGDDRAHRRRHHRHRRHAAPRPPTCCSAAGRACASSPPASTACSPGPALDRINASPLERC